MDHTNSIQRLYDLINAGDIDGFGRQLADDFVEHNENPGVPPTKAGTLQYFQMLVRAFPDFRMDVQDVIASGDKAVARVRVAGTHQGEFMGKPASGKSVAVILIDITRFGDDGLAREHWGESTSWLRYNSSVESQPGHWPSALLEDQFIAI